MQWGFALRGMIGLVTSASAGLVSFALPNASPARRVAYAAAAIVAVGALDVALVPLVHDHALRGTPGVAFSAITLSSIPWEWSIRLSPVSLDFDPRQLLFKIPTWLGLAAIPLSLVEFARRKRT
jgi:hypothetical protein